VVSHKTALTKKKMGEKKSVGPLCVPIMFVRSTTLGKLCAPGVFPQNFLCSEPGIITPMGAKIYSRGGKNLLASVKNNWVLKIWGNLPQGSQK